MADPIDILARTIWGEARGLGPSGMSAVAAVVMNRANNPRWWGTDVVAVCQKPWQFSCWNNGDPNRAKLIAVGPDDSQFADALGIADAAVRGTLADPTHGADSYFDSSIPAPEWAMPEDFTVQIGSLSFYRTEL